MPAPCATSLLNASLAQACGVMCATCLHGWGEELERHHAAAERRQPEPEQQRQAHGLLLGAEQRAYQDAEPGGHQVEEDHHGSDAQRVAPVHAEQQRRAEDDHGGLDQPDHHPADRLAGDQRAWPGRRGEHPARHAELADLDHRDGAGHRGEEQEQHELGPGALVELAEGGREGTRPPATVCLTAISGTEARAAWPGPGLRRSWTRRAAPGRTWRRRAARPAYRRHRAPAGRSAPRGPGLAM